MSDSITQNNPIVIQSDAPQPPNFLSVGYFYHPLNSNQLFVGQYDSDSGALSWISVAGSNPIPSDVDIYVDSVNGHNDTGDGSITNPFQTLAWAYGHVPASPTGLCRLNLVGAGPYSLPSFLTGVEPMGREAEPLMICGAAMQVINTGTVQSVADPAITTVGTMIADQYRGYYYHGLSGSSVDQYFLIAKNSTTQLFSIGGTFNAAPGDTFEIVQPITQLVSTGDVVISGTGRIGFWQCDISAVNITAADHASALFDSCTVRVSNSLTAELQSSLQFMATYESPDFKIVSSVGTQAGKTGAYFPTPKASRAIAFLDSSSGLGYLVSNGGLSAFRSSQVYLKGVDFNLLSSAGAVALNSAQQSSVIVDTGYCNIVSSNSSGIGLSVGSNSYGSISLPGASITNAGLAAVVVFTGGEVDLGHVSGSTGNGYGVLVQPGGMLGNSGGNTVTGTGGAVVISPSIAPTAWVSVPTVSFGGSASSSGSTILTDPSFYVSPAGSDSNDGSIGSPFLSINHALQVLTPGWYGVATINLRAGLNVISNETVIPAGLGNTNPAAGGLLINGVDNLDSGLGTKTSAGGTTGSGVTFGTVIAAGGGLTVNAYRGSFLRFTSGSTLNGQVYLIEKNSATTFTVEGTIPIAPTTETFVVETPGAAIGWVASQQISGNGGVLGLQNVLLNGAGSANYLRISQAIVGLQKVQFTNIGSAGILLRDHCSLVSLTSLSDQFGQITIPRRCGAYFNFAGPIYTSSTGRIDLLNCLFQDAHIESQQTGWTQVIDSTFRGNAYVRGLFGSSLALSRVHFDTVTPAPTDTDLIGGFGAAVVLSKGATGSIIDSDISNTPATFGAGDAILVEDGSRLQLKTVTGTANAGVGGRVSRSSEIIENSAITVTGTLGDMKCGAAAIAAWPASATVVNAAELCLIVGA